MSLSPSPVYQYQPLRGNQPIRLLVLLPSKTFHADLRCEIIHIDLLDLENFHPPYVALSYAWGSNVKNHVAWLGSCHLPITASLDAALRAIRKDSWEMLLWVDAVSINQDDIDEKNMQVANMIDVYSRAASVLLWTGEDDAQRNGEKCLQWLELLGRNTIAGLTWEIGQTEMDLFKEFFSRDWFRRRWVIQEAAVAGHAFVLCGSKRISWYDFIEGVAVLRVRHDQIPGNETHEALEKLCMIELLNKRRRSAEGSKTPQTWPGILQILSQFEDALCSDDRDRILSLLRLAQLEDADLPAWSSMLNYSLSTEDIYRRAAILLLKESDNYSLLHYAGAYRSYDIGQSTLPSWVPDWRFRSRFMPFLHDIMDLEYQRGARNCVVSENGSTLSVRGYVYDRIASGFQTFVSVDRRVQCLTDASKDLLQRDIDKDLASLRPSLNIQLNTALGFLSHPFNSGRITADEMLKAVNYEPKGSPTDHFKMIEKDNRQSHTEADKQAMRRVMRGRKIYSTQNRALCIGPADARVSDVIIVLHGLRTPFIVREDKGTNKWCLIGDTFVSDFQRTQVRTQERMDREFTIS